jgi:hypothetical protein
MMTDADGLLADRFAATRDELDDADWGDVVRRHSRRAPTHRRFVLIAAVAVAAIVVPTFALSASVRGLLGFGFQPDYAHARLAVSAPISKGRVARVWMAPAKGGGVCEFVTIDPAGTTTKPARATGGGMCSKRPGLGPGLSWSFSRGRGPTPTLFHGYFAHVVPVTRVELRWHGGSQRLATAHRFFLGEVPVLADPPFSRLPFDLVVLGPGGRTVARERIPTSFLYTDWKKVQPQLHLYRVAHGCTTKTNWVCRSR